MAGAIRTVRTLRLAAADRGGVAPGARLVREALRLASPPAQRGRLLLVRRLDLGRLDPRSSAQSVALRVEERLRALAPLALHGASPDAASAPAVFFADRAEALALAVERTFAGTPLVEWFWPRALPLRPFAPPAPRRVRALLFAPPSGPAEVLALLDACARLARRGLYVRALLEAAPASVEALRLGFGLAPCSKLRGSDACDVAREEIPAEWRAQLEEGNRALPRVDSRRQWLFELCLAADDPGRLADPELSGRAAALAGSGLGRAVLRRGLRERDVPALRSAAFQTDEPPLRALGSGEGARGLERPLEGARLREPSRARDREHLAQLELGRAAAPECLAESPAISAYAGLPFLLAVLRRLSIDSWLDEHPAWIEAELARRVLAVAARRLRAPDADAAVEALAPARPSVSPPDGRFSSPVAWWSRDAPLLRRGPLRAARVAHSSSVRILTDASRSLVLAAHEGAVPAVLRTEARRRGINRVSPVVASLGELVIQSWFVAASRWLRRTACIPMGELVRRPGLVHASRTHLDVHFDAAAAEVRVRRLGLDLDPGWMPWLGRVVTYHYDAGAVLR